MEVLELSPIRRLQPTARSHVDVSPERNYESSSSGTSSTRACLLDGRESSESGTSSMRADRLGEGEPSPFAGGTAVDLPFALLFSDFSLLFFLVFFLGRSHSQRGMKDST